MSFPSQPMPDDRSPPPPTARLGRYELTGRIATGGMATVYLARLEATGGFAREFALKVVHPHLVAEPGFLPRFHREAKLASRVRHQNVVTTIDAGEDKGYCYLVLELIEGATLRQLMLHRERPFAALEAAHLVSEVARGLHALHTATSEDGKPLSIVHRDLSPHNVMLDLTGRAVLIDLGLAKAEDNPNMTQVGVLCGKLPYMSPEQSRLESLDARSDVFALGTVLYELCTGTLPFGDTHTTATLTRLQECNKDEIVEGLQEVAVPTWLTEIIVGCLRPEPDDRYPSALALADALSSRLVGSGHSSAELRERLAAIMGEAMPAIGLVTPIEPMAPALLGGSRGRALRWMGLGAASALVVFGGLYATGHWLPEAPVKADGGAAMFGDAHVAPEPSAQPVAGDGGAAAKTRSDGNTPATDLRGGSPDAPDPGEALDPAATDTAAEDPASVDPMATDGDTAEPRRRFRPRSKKPKADGGLRVDNPYQ